MRNTQAIRAIHKKKRPLQCCGTSSLLCAARKNSLKLRLSARKYRPQRLQDIWGHKFSDAPNIVACNLLYQRGAQIKIFVRGHQKNSLDFAVKMAVHLRHLKLKLKVGNRPQAAYDGARARTKSTVKPSNASTLTFLIPFKFSSKRRFLVWKSSNGPFPALRATATTTSSNRRNALCRTSRCPFVTGSNVPG